MSCFDSIHQALHNSNLGKAVNEAKHHPAKVASAAKFAMMVA